MKLNSTTLLSIKLHYQEEYQKTLKQLKEFEAILTELEDVVVPINTGTIDIGLENKTVPLDMLSQKNAVISKETQKRSYKKRAKKRGRKSVWGSFIIKRLRSVNRPLTYDELANHAQVSFNLDPEEYMKTRRALVGAVFQLRNKQGKVYTFPKSNSRDKYVLLEKWVDKNKKPFETMQAYME